MTDRIYTDMNGRRYISNMVATPSVSSYDYERGFVDGMQKQTESSVYKAIDKMCERHPWVGLTDEELLDIADLAYANDLELMHQVQAKLKEKNQ